MRAVCAITISLLITCNEIGFPSQQGGLWDQTWQLWRWEWPSMAIVGHDHQKKRLHEVIFYFLIIFDYLYSWLLKVKWSHLLLKISSLTFMVQCQQCCPFLHWFCWVLLLLLFTAVNIFLSKLYILYYLSLGSHWVYHQFCKPPLKMSHVREIY